MVIKTTEKKKKYDGRTTDFTLQWMVKNYGQAWETWRKLAEEWMINQDAGTSTKLDALAVFFEVYLIGSVPFTSDVISFFIGKNNWQASIEEFKRIMLEKTNKGDNSDII